MQLGQQSKSETLCYELIFLFDTGIMELFGAVDAAGAENTLFLLLQLKFSKLLYIFGVKHTCNFS